MSVNLIAQTTTDSTTLNFEKQANANKLAVGIDTTAVLPVEVDSVKAKPVHAIGIHSNKKRKFYWSASSYSTDDSSMAAKKIRRHNPLYAALFSMALPGLGQAYNKKYWKIPIVYVGFGAMIYLFERNNTKYNSFKTALIQRTNGDTDIYLKQIPTTQGLSEYKDYYRRNRDLSVIGFALIYILNVVDANVDANLFYFDVSDDLSLQWSPIINPSYSYATGVSLKLKF